MKSTYRSKLAILVTLFLALVLTACGSSPTNTPVPAPTTVAPTATTAPVAPTAAPTTAVAAATTTAPRPTTGSRTTQQTFDSFTQLEVPKQVTDVFIRALPLQGVTNLQVALFVSDLTDTAKAADGIDANLRSGGYTFGFPGVTKPIVQGNQVIGAYTKTGSPDVIFVVQPLDTNQLNASSLQSIGVAQADIQKILSGLQGKKMAATFIYADGLINGVFNAVTSGLSITPGASTTVNPAGTAPVTRPTTAAGTSTSAIANSFVELAVPKQFADLLIGALPVGKVQNPQVKFFVSPENDPAKGAEALDAKFIKDGYKFALPNGTKPIKNGNAYVGAYTKDASSPEALIAVSTLENANFNTLNETALIALGATPAEAKKFADTVKGAKIIAIFVYAPDLIKSING